MHLPPTEIRFPPPQGGRVDVLIVAGEHSGDEQAARMVSELLNRHPHMRVAALGGPEVAGVGAQLLFDLTAWSVVGLVEVLKNFRFFQRVFREAFRWIAEYRPRVVCFVDYPGFNLRLARALAKAGLSRKGGGSIRLVYYISPQIWAWKPRRRFAMAKTLDAMAVIFPFEVKHYADTALPARFVGHPFVSEGYVAPVAYAPHGPVLLLPGSRTGSVARIAPVLLDGFAAFQRGRTEAKALMLYPSEVVRRVLLAELERRPRLAPGVALAPNDTPTTASAVLTSSGTMSLVCALAGLPGAITYRTNPLTFRLAQHLVQVRYIGIANLLLPQPIYPEFVQDAATPQALAAELTDCVENPARLEFTRRLAEQLRHALAQPPQGDAGDWLAEQVHA